MAYGVRLVTPLIVCGNGIDFKAISINAFKFVEEFLKLFKQIDKE